MGPGGKYVSKQRAKTWVGDAGVVHGHSPMLAASEELLFEAKGVRAPPLDADGNVNFLAGTNVEVELDGSRGWTSGCAALSVEAEK